MKLPNRKQADVPLTKLKDYLLSETHAGGKTKAKFFRKCGFDESNIDLFMQGLITIAQNQEITEVVSSPHGKKYIIDGSISSPLNRIVNLRTVWIIDEGQEKPRFITAYPI
jgi:hypothetical protein